MDSEQQLRDLLANFATPALVAQHLGVSTKTVYLHMEIFGIPVARPRIDHKEFISNADRVIEITANAVLQINRQIRFQHLSASARAVLLHTADYAHIYNKLRSGEPIGKTGPKIDRAEYRLARRHLARWSATHINSSIFFFDEVYARHRTTNIVFVVAIHNDRLLGPILLQHEDGQLADATAENLKQALERLIEGLDLRRTYMVMDMPNMHHQLLDIVRQMFAGRVKWGGKSADLMPLDFIFTKALKERVNDQFDSVEETIEEAQALFQEIASSPDFRPTAEFHRRAAECLRKKAI